MPTALLREHQHELTDESEEFSLLFGTEDTGYLTMTPPLVIAGDLRVNDRDRPGEGGRSFARDYRGGKAYQFDIGVITDRTAGYVSPHLANNDALADFEVAWTDERWSNHPSAYAVLRTCEAGRVSRCYGRPRPYEETVGVLTAQGFTPVTAQFLLIDDKWYSDTISTHILRAAVTVGAGLYAPMTSSRLKTNRSSSSSNDVVIGGKAKTWPIVHFDGPCKDPEVTFDGGAVVVGLTGELPAGYRITYDPRPWARTVLGSDGTSWGGAISARSTSMPRALLAPGTHKVSYRSTDPTGESVATIQWRDARPRP